MLRNSTSEGIRSDETTIISHNVKIEGKVSSDGNIKVDGRIKGDINCQSNVNIGEGGEVNGHISASNISIAGTVVGTINAKEKLTLEPKGNLKGDVFTKILAVEAGAKFEGNIKMGDNQYAPKIKGTDKPEVLNTGGVSV